MRVYAIGDIHGHLDKLRSVHALIAADKARVGDPDAVVVHVGDLVDRGPESAGVLSYLAEGLEAGQPWVILKGNHDRMMRRFLEPDRLRDPSRPDLHWLQDNIGGRSTLESYGVDTDPARGKEAIHTDARAAVPEAHVTLLDGLVTHHHMPGLYFVHAGVRPGVGFADQVEDDLVWIREPFLSDARDHGALVVHGHSPVAAATHYGNRLNIDSAAAYGGPLSAVVIEGAELAVSLLTETGRRPLVPVQAALG
ncbi:metallophosphoesterase [Oceanicola sp. 502str15]|uniref:metallophosphoesterase n=1 Tax=Oceanicola sp. 502str15 TaxID=2696061 RepID=UPI00209614B2|nr:metallophosphoesterase [Oceanicola sp. 502str15]MCO6384576.1 serine/threonine protein phosphatase [Oceanicola sp. 502str15]